MSLPKSAPWLTIILHLLLVMRWPVGAVSGFYMQPPPPTPPPQPVCDPWSEDHSSKPPPDICTNPSFDAAVSVSDSQMLLFKGAHMWLLDSLNYQVSRPLTNCLLHTCFATANRANLRSATPADYSEEEQQPQPYYVWNQHERLRFYPNRICMQGVRMRHVLCHFSSLSELHSFTTAHASLSLAHVFS